MAGFWLIATVCGWAAVGVFLYLGVSKWLRTNREMEQLYDHYLEGLKRKKENHN